MFTCTVVKKKTVCNDVEGWKLLASTGVQVGPSSAKIPGSAPEISFQVRPCLHGVGDPGLVG